MYATLNRTNWTPYCLAHGAGGKNEEPPAAFVRLSMGRTIPLHLAGLLAVEVRLPVCTCKGSLRAVGFAVTPAGLLKGLGSPGQ